ncbi:MAG: SLC13 family permease [Sedimentibacter sp.]|uniref:SLC13 family permease n=1 Tax=Sedimentibacter sp. TaxID=1960295 RepID=UPI002980FE93|nr:SLC13 family permease [Sedimentibacter sp.]MDW5299606.1 SLC13 family permease [Sedimentibacter sp.]
MKKIIITLKKEAVLIISFVAALITSCFVPPSAEYLSYIDFKVLAILFCLMVIVAGLKEIGLFNVLAEKMTSGSRNTRGLFLSLVLICFFSSMLITNDVALITFVPFSILVLTITAQTEHLINVVVMQTVAANLGSMLTPVGNPQNLYLYSFFNMEVSEFFKITLPITLAGLILIFAFSIFGKRELINVQFNTTGKIADKRKMILYMLLFVLCLTTVFRFVDYRITLAIVFAAVMLLDKNLLLKVDYSLLATFVFFFIFTGNIGNIEPVKNYLSLLIENHELIYSILLSQVLSNVPTAVLLSNFTENYKALIVGTNVGGLGTLVASLASLISFKLYVKTENSKPVKYLAVFTAINILILLLLLIFSTLFILNIKQ